jgi:hypothetical protein
MTQDINEEITHDINEEITETMSEEIVHGIGEGIGEGTIKGISDASDDNTNDNTTKSTEETTTDSITETSRGNYGRSSMKSFMKMITGTGKAMKNLIVTAASSVGDSETSSGSMEIESFVESDDEDEWHSLLDEGTRTGNGAECLATTGSANLDLFASPLIYFDGERVAEDMDEKIKELHLMLKCAYEEDSVLLIKNILHLGNLRNSGKKSHPAYMVSLVWFWQWHPKTFLAALAPNIEDNTSARDLLTLYCVITFNRSYPTSRLYEGEQPDSMVGVGWVTVKEQEKEIWKKLLKEFGVKAKEVVKHQELHAPRMKKLKPSYEETEGTNLERDMVAFSSDSNTGCDNTSGYTPDNALDNELDNTSDNISDNTSDNIPDNTSTITWGTTHSVGCMDNSTEVIEDSGMGASTTGASTTGASTTGGSTTGGGGKRPRIKTGKKNIWLNTAFKEAYQLQKSKLHQRDYGVVSGVLSDPGDYKDLTDFVVNLFATGLERKDDRIGKWAPSANASHDKATRGVNAFDLPQDWNGGLSQAIAWNLFGGLVKKDENDDINGVVFSLAESKRFVMTRYSKLLSEIRRTWVPENLEGCKATCKESPVLGRCTARWRLYRSRQTQTTTAQKDNLSEYYKNVAAGAVGFKPLTSGGNRPHVLMRECCIPQPTLLSNDEDMDTIIEDSILDDMAYDNSANDHVMDEEKADEMQKWSIQRENAVLQFESIIESVKKTLAGKDVEIITVADVSGSMTQCKSVPMDVAVSMGMILAMAQASSSPYAKKVLTFESECRINSITAFDDKQIDRFDRIKKAREEIMEGSAGTSTNLLSVFERVVELERGRVRVVGEPIKPLIVVVITDMNFDEGIEDEGEELLQEDILKDVCKKAGLLIVPTIVYFDVAGSGKMSYPAAANTSGVVLISGYSESAIKCLASADFSDVSPMSFMLSAMEELPYDITDDMVAD